MKRSALITAYQSIVFSGSSAAQWTHVAIYDGQGLFWDAMPKVGVRQHTIADTLRNANCTVCLKRIRAPARVDEPRLKAFLPTQLHENYSLTNRQTMTELSRRMFGVRPLGLPIDATDVFCSKLVSRAMNQCVANYTFPHRIALPGDFVALPDYEEIDLYWCHA